MTKQKQTSHDRLTAALAVITDNFTDVVQYTDRNGEIKDWNRLGFPLVRFLRGALYQLHSGLDYNENVRSAKLKDDYEQARNANQQTELTIAAMEDAIRRKHELDDQNLATKEFISVLEAEYEKQVGKAYVHRPSPKAMAAKPVDNKAADQVAAGGDELFGIA